MRVCLRLSSDPALIDMSGFDFCEFMHEPLHNTCFHIRKEESVRIKSMCLILHISISDLISITSLVKEAKAKL